MAAKDIVKHQFQKGQSGNINGRPPKAITKITTEMIKKGYRIPSKTDILDAGLILMSLTIQEINAIATGEGECKHYPYYYIRVAQELLSDRGFEIIEKILDRALGKATQKNTVTTTVENVAPQFIVSSKEQAEEIKEFLQELEK